MHIDTPWTDSAIARLRKLWDEGLSAAEIGRRLDISKNAVIGKAHRLDLAARISPIKRGPRQAHVRSSTSRPRRPSATLPKPSCLQRVALAPAAQAVPRGASAPSSTGTPDRLSSRIARQCCWPIGDPGMSNFRFCNIAALPGKPYCEAHARLAYLKASSRSENNKRNAAAG